MDSKKIIKELERRRHKLSDELQVIGYSIINDKNMPIAVKEVRIIQANALEHEINLLTKRISELHKENKHKGEEYNGK